MPSVKIKMIVWGCLLFLAGSLHAQQDKVAAAITYLESGKLDSAKIVIEQAVNDPRTGKTARPWLMRGYIYKEIYRQREASDKNSPAREEAINSFIKSLSLDSASENQKSNKAYIKFLATKYYNDAVASLNPVHYKVAIENYQKYRRAILIAEPVTNIRQKDIEFTLALGSTYTKIFESDRTNNTAFLDLAKNAFGRVLALDSNNISGNYNLGLLYYNQAVYFIQALDYSEDIQVLDKIQDNNIILFREALPFMKKAHKLDPKRKEVLIALAGIYFSLNDFEKSNEFMKKLQELEQKK